MVTTARTPGSIGKAIRSRRQALGLRLEEVAVRSGLSMSTLGRIERGAGDPSLRTLEAIARALETTSSELLGDGEAA